LLRLFAQLYRHIPRLMEVWKRIPASNWQPSKSEVPLRVCTTWSFPRNYASY